MSLPERLRLIRGQLGQKEFAKRIDSSQTGVSAYEKGQRKPDYETLIRVSQEFGVTLDWLLLGTGSMYIEDNSDKTADMSAVLPAETASQPIENIEYEKNKSADMSEKLRLRQKLEQSLEKMVELQERLLALTEQNADLRLQLKERDLRIRELERENAGLREALKGAAAVQREAAGWQAG